MDAIINHEKGKHSLIWCVEELENAKEDKATQRNNRLFPNLRKTDIQLSWSTF